jgi:hypothetical protein
MSDKSFAISKSVLTIVLLLSLLGFVVTQALFRDRFIADQSTFVVGTLEMTIDGQNNNAAERIVVTNIGGTSSLSGTRTWEIKNSGSLPGELLFRVEDLINFEHGCNDPESLVDATCADPGPNEGELGNVMQVVVSIGSAENEEVLVVSNMNSQNAGQFSAQWAARPEPVLLNAGDTLPVTFAWSVADSAYENEIQSDSIEFDVVFDLKQLSSQ